MKKLKPTILNKLTAVILLTVLALYLSSCSTTIERNSLVEYKECIIENKYATGFSSLGLDDPKYFLPNDTFIEDYTYVDGGYYLLENDPFSSDTQPSRCILWLKYDANIYNEAKAVVDGILSLAEKTYSFDTYVFSLHQDLRENQTFTPDWFTMVGYNEQTCTLFFLGFHKEDMSISEVSELMESDFELFLNTFWGEYYNF